MDQIAHWTKATTNWDWNSGVCIFIVLFHLFQDMQSKQRYIWSYYHLSSEQRNKKKLDWQETGKAVCFAVAFHHNKHLYLKLHSQRMTFCCRWGLGQLAGFLYRLDVQVNSFGIYLSGGSVFKQSSIQQFRHITEQETYIHVHSHLQTLVRMHKI